MKAFAFIFVVTVMLAFVVGTDLKNSELAKIYTGPELARRYGMETDQMDERSTIENEKLRVANQEELRNLSQLHRNAEQIQLMNAQAGAKVLEIIVWAVGVFFTILALALAYVAAVRLTTKQRVWLMREQAQYHLALQQAEAQHLALPQAPAALPQPKPAIPKLALPAPLINVQTALNKPEVIETTWVTASKL